MENIYNKMVSDAIKESEQKKQEAEKSKIKKIVQSHLEKIEDLTIRKGEIDKELKVLKDDLEDLRHGRLDKIEERQGIDPEHNKHTIIVVRKIEKEYIPMQPWKSPWAVDWSGTSCPSAWFGSTGTSSTGITNITNSGTSGFNTDYITATGTAFQNFVQGMYNIHNKLINL